MDIVKNIEGDMVTHYFVHWENYISDEQRDQDVDEK